MAHRSAGQSVLARVVAVLEAFDLDHGSLTASDIARRAGLSTPTAHRIVAELVELGLLERAEGHRVHVGVRFWEIAAMAPRALGLREAAMPFMEDVQGITGQHTQLYVREGREALVIEKLSARDAVLNFTRIGGRQPLHATTGGLVLLAYADLELQESILAASLRSYAENTPTDPARIRRILAGVREYGHVICDGYVSPEVVGVGVPVRSPQGEVIAALGVLVPREVAPPLAYVNALVVASWGITRTLGNPPPRTRPPRFFPDAEIG